MQNLLTTSEEGLKKARFLFEVQGLIKNKTLFEIEEVLATTRRRKTTRVFNNPYTIGRKV